MDEGISFFYLNIMVREPHVKCCSCISDFLCQPGASKSCERRPGDFIIIIILKFQSTLTLCTCLKLKQQWFWINSMNWFSTIMEFLSKCYVFNSRVIFPPLKDAFFSVNNFRRSIFNTDFFYGFIGLFHQSSVTKSCQWKPEGYGAGCNVWQTGATEWTELASN